MALRYHGDSRPIATPEGNAFLARKPRFIRRKEKIAREKIFNNQCFKMTVDGTRTPAGASAPDQFRLRDCAREISQKAQCAAETGLPCSNKDV